VYEATWKGVKVAVKKSLSKRDIPPEEIDQLLHEISLMNYLQHPNVLQFYGACLKAPNICMIVELVELGTTHLFIFHALFNDSHHRSQQSRRLEESVEEEFSRTFVETTTANGSRRRSWNGLPLCTGSNYFLATMPYTFEWNSLVYISSF